MLLCGAVPAILPALWIQDLALQVRANSLDAYSRDLLVLYRWAHQRSLCLETRLRSLKPLSGPECRSIASALSTTKGERKASKSTIERRIASVTLFIRFAFEVFSELAHLSPVLQMQCDRASATSCSRLMKYMRFAINSASPSLPAHVLKANEKAALKEVIDPASPRNPFESNQIRIRNHCIINLMLETGVRRAELVLLELDDLNLGGLPTVRIRSSLSHFANCRRDGASPKTRSRTVPITATLARNISSYLESVRPELAQGCRLSRALFISGKDGRRLSLTAVNHLVAKLSVAAGLPEGSRLHPHGLRSTAATDARRAIDAKGLAVHAEMEESLSYFGGWAPGSRMVRRYTREALSERVSRKIRARVDGSE